ncbi:MAG: helix-turn-helix domain-containing protein [Candidatus Woesearchaeota archaeon]
MDESILEQIGMTKSEIKVYLALLELGCSSTGKIVEKSGASSSKIYEILDKLMQKGLVSFIIKSGVKHFESASPSRIMEYMKEREEEIIKQKESLRQILPALELKQQLSKYKSEATIFKGIKGAETAFRLMINKMQKKDELIAFIIDYNEEDKYFNLMTRIHKLRIEKGLSSRLIFNPRCVITAKDRTKMPNTRIKYASGDARMPAIVNVGGNITLLNIMAEEATVFMIDSKEVADSFRSQFEKMWSEQVNVFKGIDNVTSLIDSSLQEMKKNDEYYVINANRGFTSLSLKKFFADYHSKRVKKGVKVNMLYNQSIKSGIKEIIKQPAEIKMLPPEFKSPLQIFLYQNKTYMTLWEEDPIGIMINNKNVADGFRVYFNSLWNQDTRIMKGMNAVKQIFEEMLEHGSCDYIAARGYFVEKAPEKYIDDWEKRALKKGFTMRNIVDPSVKGHRITSFPFAKTKFTLPKEFANLSVFWIYGDKIAISNWMENEPIIIVIENKNLHDMYKQQFELLWNQDVFAQKGMDNVHYAWNNMLDELKPGEEYYVLSSSWHGQSSQMKKFFRDFHTRRIKKGVSVRFIFPSDLRNLIKKNKDVYHNKGFVKYHSNMMYEGMQINLYKNKVLIFIWREKEPIIMTIEDKNVYNGFNKYFELMWDMAFA